LCIELRHRQLLASVIDNVTLARPQQEQVLGVFSEKPGADECRLPFAGEWMWQVRKTLI
jgi:hypothetical protein